MRQLKLLIATLFICGTILTLVTVQMFRIQQLQLEYMQVNTKVTAERGKMWSNQNTINEQQLEIIQKVVKHEH